MILDTHIRRAWNGEWEPDDRRAYQRRIRRMKKDEIKAEIAMLRKVLGHFPKFEQESRVLAAKAKAAYKLSALMQVLKQRVKYE